MTKRHILQVGSCPAWDQQPLDLACNVHRRLEASDRDAFLATACTITRGDRGCDRNAGWVLSGIRAPSFAAAGLGKASRHSGPWPYQA